MPISIRPLFFKREQSRPYIVYTGIILSNFSKISVKYKKNVTLAGLHGFGDSGGQELFNGNVIYAQLF